MTRRPPERYRHPSRGLQAEEVGPYLGRAPSWFYLRRPQLERAGFPKPDELIGTYDKRAIDLWWDARSGLVDGEETDWEARFDQQLERDFPETAAPQRRHA